MHWPVRYLRNLKNGIPGTHSMPLVGVEPTSLVSDKYLVYLLNDK
jgi:hypothetical protein